MRFLDAFFVRSGSLWGSSGGTFGDPNRRLLALGSLLEALRLPKRRFHANTSKTNRI